MDEKVRPTAEEGAVLGQALSQVSWLVMSAYLGVNEMYAELLPYIQEDLRWMVPAMIFIATAGVGWTIEAKALKEKGFTVNPVTNYVYGKSGKTVLSMAAGSAYGLVSNPANLVLIGNIAAERDQSITTLAHLSAVFSLGVAYTGINAYIAKGKTDEVVKGLHWVNEHTSGKVTQVRNSLIKRIEL
jgi:phosphoglycerol transferase MdoB-like AlkP superfamily enzyme